MEKPIIFKNFRDFLLQEDFIDIDEFIKKHENEDDYFYLDMLRNGSKIENEKYEVAIGLKYKNDYFNNDFEGYIVVKNSDDSEDGKLIHGLYGFR